MHEPEAGVPFDEREREGEREGEREREAAAGSRPLRLVISVNVFCNLPFLLAQLANFRSMVCAADITYRVVLNCNGAMLAACAANAAALGAEVTLHPHALEKQRFHGSLLQGICANMRLAGGEFDLFLVMSSRTLLRRELTRAALEELAHMPLRCAHWYDSHHPYYWYHWPAFLALKLADRVRAGIGGGGGGFVGTMHEGLAISREGCARALEFLDCPAHAEITQELFTCNQCVEEFALQTICHNAGAPFFSLGCDAHEEAFAYKATNSARGFVLNDHDLFVPGLALDLPVVSGDCCYLTKRGDGEYEFHKPPTSEGGFHRWAGWRTRVCGTRKKMRVSFDIRFLAEVPTRGAGFALKTHYPLRFYEDWLRQCREDEWTSVRIEIEVEAPPGAEVEELAILIADDARAPVHFLVKNAAIHFV